MTLQPGDAALSSRINHLIERRSEAFRKQVPEQYRAIELRHSARGTLSSPQAIEELRRGIHEPFVQFSEGMTTDLLEAVKGHDGTVSNDVATWIRQRLEPELTSNLDTVIEALQDGQPHRQNFNSSLRLEAATMISDARRQLAIAIGRATRSRRGSATTAPVQVDLASVDELVRLKNRRGFTADFTRMFSEASAAAEPLALVRIDVDRFKQVNDRHGGHTVGDEALVAIGKVLQACVRGKGEAYRVGGDEFVLLLPNHTTDEATAVGERVRLSVHARPLTSRALTLSVSVGVAAYPDHAADASALEQAADDASYDAKNRGRNLVRVFGEPEPPTTGRRRGVERKQPQPGGLTDEQKDKIRSDYFRHSLARCPHDEAILKVTDVSDTDDTVYRIDVVCPFCGLTARLPD